MNRNNVFNLGLLLILLVVGGWGATAVLTPLVHADTITVTTTADEVNNDGDCSLREAILAANGDTAVDNCSVGSGADVITLPPGTYTLSLAGAGEDAAQTGDLDLTANVTINGGGMNNSIIDGAGADRIFEVHTAAQVTINDLTVRNGSATSGGGINVSGALTLSGSRVTGSTATGVGGGTAPSPLAAAASMVIRPAAAAGSSSAFLQPPLSTARSAATPSRVAGVESPVPGFSTS